MNWTAWWMHRAGRHAERVRHCTYPSPDEVQEWPYDYRDRFEQNSHHILLAVSDRGTIIRHYVVPTFFEDGW